MNTFTWIAIAVYLLGMISVGIYFSKRTKSTSEYFLGGRKLGPFVTAMSAEASDMSSWLLMGLPGVALAGGLCEASWTAIGLAVGTYINFLLVAKRIRVYSSKIDAVTVPEFFSKRFGEGGKILSVVSALVIVIFFIPYTASGFNACGTLFNSLSGGDIPYRTAMLISAAVIVAYTALGGFLAASTTDFVQSIVMTLALVVVVFFGVGYAGGWSSVVENAKNLPSFTSLLSSYDMKSGASGGEYGFLNIVSTLAWGLGYFGMPHILLRFMAIKDSKKLATSRRIATSWVVVSMGVAILIGVIGSAAVSNGAISLTAENSQRIIIEIAKKIGENGIFFALLTGVIISGILASTMSTADSQLLAASSSISKDLLGDVFGLKISQKKSMIISRLTIVVIAVVAVFWAWNEDSVFTIVSFAWAGFGAAFGPVVLFSLFWKRTTKWGALAGMITGGAMVFIWKYLISKLGGVFKIYELLPAFVLACVALVVVSLLTKKPDESVEKTFNEVSVEAKAKA